ncbi:MAG: glycosyltransferase, partial [Thermoproteota archaeon]|nr:glycosyltransferase [Thermoproteota archaeon]
LGIPARFLVKSLKGVTHYNPFIDLSKHKLKKSSAGICFSEHVSKLLGGGLKVIYHGAEPSLAHIPSKSDARKYFSIPVEKKVAATVGFRTVTKGWDMLAKVNLSDDWVIISNSAKSHYSKETFEKQKTKKANVIDLQRGYLSEEDLSMLFYASDILLLPYKITSGSGVMFDALAHGLPFVSSDLEFFKEFARVGLGIASKRNPKSFENAIDELSKNYENYLSSVNQFKEKLDWMYVSKQHIETYADSIKDSHSKTSTAI